MKKYFVAATALICGSVFAQELPTPSSKASVEQRIGLTDISVAYHRPNVNDRDVFGALVPYEKMWRTGANKATALTFSTEVMIMDEVLPAGTYSLFAIPGQDQWTLVFNTETELWGTGNYKEENDVMRVMVAPEMTNFTESFTIDFQNVSKTSGMLCLRWAETQACVPIQVDVDKKALANISEAVSSDDANWAVFRTSASYFIDNDVDHVQALEWMKKSVEMKDDNWYSHYLLGRAYHLNGDKKMAKKSVKNALKMYRDNTEEGDRPYEAMLEAALKEWK